MNRNSMYELLQSKGLKNIIVRHSKQKYHMKFTFDNDSDIGDCDVITDWGFIHHVHTFHLCMNQVVMECRYGPMLIYLNYENIKTFDVRMYARDGSIIHDQ